MSKALNHYKDYFAFIKLTPKEKLIIVSTVLKSCLQAAFFLLITYSVGRIFDLGIAQNNPQELIFSGIVIFATYLMAYYIDLTNRRRILGLTKEVITRLRRDILVRILEGAHLAEENASKAQLHSIIVHNTERVDIMLGALIGRSLPAVLIAAALLSVCAVISPLLTILVVIGSLMNLVFALKLRPIAAKSVSLYHDSFKNFSERILDLIGSMEVVRAHGAVRVEGDRTTPQLHNLRDRGQSTSLLHAYNSLGQQAITALIVVMVLVLGGLSVISGGMQIGELAGFYAGLLIVRSNFFTIVDQIPSILAGLISLSEINEICRGIKIPISNTKSNDKEVPNAGLILESVSFEVGGREILQGVTFKVEPGETIAISGINGSGKTTLLRLILGLYAPNSGRITINGVTPFEIHERNLNSMIGYVPQNSELISGSIIDNIMFGNEEIGLDSIEKACVLLGLKQIIENMPDGIDQKLSPDTSLISGGQKQLLAIARAVVRRPKIYILDEPTAHLAPATATRIIEAIRAFSPEGMIILTTHDPKIFSMADHHINLTMSQIKSVEKVAV